MHVYMFSAMAIEVAGIKRCIKRPAMLVALLPFLMHACMVYKHATIRCKMQDDHCRITFLVFA